MSEKSMYLTKKVQVIATDYNHSTIKGAITVGMHIPGSKQGLCFIIEEAPQLLTLDLIVLRGWGILF